MYRPGSGRLRVSLLFIFYKFLVWKLHLAQGPSFPTGCVLVMSILAGGSSCVEGLSLVVVTTYSDYIYCLRNWEILSAEFRGVHSIMRDRAKSVARRGCAFINWYLYQRLSTVKLFSSTYK